MQGVTEIFNEFSVGKGIFNAIRYFSDRGMLGDQSSTKVIKGRNKEMNQ